jgi:hypothetical protein
MSDRTLPKPSATGGIEPEVLGREFRTAAIFLSDTMNFDTMMNASSAARRALTYFLVTGSAVLHGIYWNTKNEVIQDFFPFLGIVFCIAIMIIGEREYDAEVKTLGDAVKFRRDNALPLGTLTTRHDQLIYTSSVQISKLDFVAILTAISWIAFGISVYSEKP